MASFAMAALSKPVKVAKNTALLFWFRSILLSRSGRLSTAQRRNSKHIEEELTLMCLAQCISGKGSKAKFDLDPLKETIFCKKVKQKCHRQGAPPGVFAVAIRKTAKGTKMPARGELSFGLTTISNLQEIFGFGLG
jgi:hypothetical protein